MIKSKISLLYKLLIIFTAFYTFFITCNSIYKSNYNEGDITLTGHIVSMTYQDNKVNIILKAKEKINVTYHTDLQLDYELGDQIKISGQLSKPSNNTVFNLFNYRLYLLSNKIYFNLKADKIEKVTDNDNFFYKIKNNVYRRIDQLKSGNYIKAFILGDKQDLDDNMQSIYRENGITHLLAISGMHVTLLASILLFFLKRFKYSHLIISLFLVFYAFLTNFTPSVLRAVFLFILNKYNKKKTIVLIACVMLLYNPYYIYNVGFLFSFVISFYLIYFGKLSNRFKNYFIKLLVTSTICFIASIPIMINNFYYINLTSPLINVIFVPFVTFIIFPLCLLVLIIPCFDNLLLFCLHIMEQLSLFFNHFNVDIIMSKINVFFFLFYYLLITIIFLKPKYFYILVVVVLVHTNIRLFNKNICLTMIDVGQGDSVLLEIKDKSILIDTGGSYFSNYSIAKNKLVPYFKSLGIKKLDYLILTHGDYDHMGEAISLINSFKVDKVIFNNGEYNDLELDLIKVLEEKNIDYYQNIEELNIANNKLYFLNNKLYDNENDNSNVVYTVLNNIKLLLMGDAGIEVEDNILNKYNLNDIDILKVGHHGSKTSSSEQFINSINPKYSMISVGKNNRYGHPNKEVLYNLDDTIIYRTDYDGSVMFQLKKDKLKINTCTP